MPPVEGSQFGEIFEHASEAYAVLNQDAELICINRAASKLLYAEFDTPDPEIDKSTKFQAAIADASRCGSWVPVSVTLSKAGQSRAYDARLRCLRDVPDARRYILSFKAEDRDRKSFRALRDEVMRAHARSTDVEVAKKRLANVIDATRAGCWECDIPSGNVWVNDYWCAMFGVDKRDANYTADSLQEMCHPEDFEAAREAMRAHVRGETEAYAIEVRLRHKDGHWIWIADTGRVVEWDEDGQPLTMAGTLIDITERREHERMLEDKRLEAEAANISKSQFLATMSHEIRTPMNGVMGMLDVVLNSTLTLQQRDHLEIAQASAESLLRLLNDILNYSKLEAGAVELERLPYSPEEVIDHVAGLLGSRAEEKSLELSVHKSPDLPDVIEGDAERLRQVLINLVGNAIKFTDFGYVEIHAGMDGDENGKRLAISVRDSGIGIPDDVKPKLFKHFVQADSSTTRRFGGTGLGLVISKQLIELMKGDISVESTPGEGTTFRITVPVSYEPVDAQTGQTDEDCEAIDETGPRIPPMRILAADDHPVNQQVIKLFLAAAGHDVMIVENGQEVLKALDEQRFDVILMDIEMSVLDGVATTAAIRVRPGEDRNTPIVAVTAHALSGDRERYLNAGMDYYVAKPFTPRELNEVLRSVLEDIGDRAVSDLGLNKIA